MPTYTPIYHTKLQHYHIYARQHPWLPYQTTALSYLFPLTPLVTIPNYRHYHIYAHLHPKLPYQTKETLSYIRPPTLLVSETMTLSYLCQPTPLVTIPNYNTIISMPTYTPSNSTETMTLLYLHIIWGVISTNSFFPNISTFILTNPFLSSYGTIPAQQAAKTTIFWNMQHRNAFVFSWPLKYDTHPPSRSQSKHSNLIFRS